MGEKAGWKYKEKPELEDACPSMLDGISPQRVEAKRLAYSSLLQDTGEAMKMCASGNLSHPLRTGVRGLLGVLAACRTFYQHAHLAYVHPY